ncbi:hypothetical protein H0I39_19630 [Ottowia beijingensis]|uniref:Uncharacterized protein n=1 Tax=Ottowia beijingensis TaxID=1207057 RepID=A0A853IZJ8_9BURK|nr:hypothetical protein [Ottowia beijingensis]NZA00570.1 hypothetical protein [Ottowia beijingensis]NZA03368.1 hypothetical protein [Ottowia beijingensis]
MTEPSDTDKKTRRGGRAPLDASSPTVIVSVRMSEKQRTKLDKLGGGPWVRERIDRARLPDEETAKPRGGSSGAKGGASRW